MKVLLALTPFVCRIWWLCEHSLVKPYDFSLLIIRLLQSLLHCIKQRNISTILRFDRHLGNIDDLLFDQVLLVHEAQAPWLDELVRELPMEKHTALLDASSDPRLQSRFRGQIVDVHLLKFKCIFLILLLAVFITNRIWICAIAFKPETAVTDCTIRNTSQSWNGRVAHECL